MPETFSSSSPANSPPQLPSGSLAFSFWIATQNLVRVMNGQSLAEGFLKKIPAEARPKVQDMIYNVLRKGGQGEALLKPLLRYAPRPSILALLLLAIYRLESRPEKGHTIVSQAVVTASFLEGGRYKGLTNAVLRNFLRLRESLFENLPEAARLCHPEWWLAALKNAYPENWQSIVEAGNQPPPMAARVNLRRSSLAASLAELQEAGISARAHGDCGLLLEKPVPLELLPGFREGRLSVQDLGAQQAARILSPEPGSSVLDACAAPGGKTAHLLERGENLALVAQDISPERCRRIEENLVRLGLSAQVRIADAATAESAAEDTAPVFDAILADVPCSGSGVARRFPDIKWLRREADILQFADTQMLILSKLWPRLAPRGKLLYATCSVFPPENGELIKRFLARCPEACLRHEEQLLPTAEHDGFYYALLQKNA